MGQLESTLERGSNNDPSFFAPPPSDDFDIPPPPDDLNSLPLPPVLNKYKYFF